MNKKNITDVIKEKIRQADRDYGLLSGRKHILVGLSGGADSCALLLSLIGMREEYGYSISAVHVNHGIRENEADRDAEFSSDLCKKMKIPFYCKCVDVPDVCATLGLSLETAARNCRYAVFQELCNELSCDCIATAHTASDNIETVLFNLIRGCALPGVCGIPAKRKLDKTDIDVIRPLLYVSRNHIEEYLAHEKQDFVIDSTNLIPDCSRNFIRHEIVPKIRCMNEDIEDTLSSFVSNVVRDNEYLDTVSQRMFTDDIYELSKMEYPVKSRIIRKMYGLKEHPEMIQNVHIKAVLSEIDACVNGEKTHSSVSLPSKKRAVIENGMITICNESREKNNCAERFEIELKSGINIVPGDKYIVLVMDDESEYENNLEYNGVVYDKYDTANICCNMSCSGLVLRNRREGDIFFFKGMNRKVKKLLSDARVPVSNRNEIPFVTENGSIVYVPCVGVGDKYAFEQSTVTENILSVAVYRIKD